MVFSRRAKSEAVAGGRARGRGPGPTPNLPTNIAPCYHRLSQTFWEIPYGHEDSTPLNWDYAWVQPSEILNLSREQDLRGGEGTETYY